MRSGASAILAVEIDWAYMVLLDVEDRLQLVHISTHFF